MRPMTRGALVLAAAAVLVVAVGCDLSNSQRRKAETATTTEISAMRGDIRRLEQDLEALDAEIRRSNDMMRTELAALESSISQLDGKSADRVAAAKQELAGEINKLEERRVADRNALNKKMDWLVDQLKKISGTSSGPSNGAVSEGMRTEKGFEYVIKDGDTVWKIASTFREKYGTTVEAILKANGLDANSIIRPGDTLFIPIRD